MSRDPLGVEGPFGLFADDVISRELPDLPDDRRAATVRFVCRRAHEVPTPLRIGVTVLALATGIARKLLGPDRTTTFLQRTSLPFVGELARMVRSLGFAFIWETWPTTTPTGAAT